MFGRIKQFIYAVTGKLKPQDHQFIQNILNEKEQNLFYHMDLSTQTHCLRVAYTCHRLARQYPAINREVLIKAALLHDIGKKAGEIKIWQKVAIVLGHRFTPALARHLIIRGRVKPQAGLARAFYIHYIHPRRGSLMAARADTAPAVSNLIATHHQPPVPLSAPEHILLYRSDNKN